MVVREVRREYIPPPLILSLADSAFRVTPTGGRQAFNEEMRLGGEIGDCDTLETGREKFSTARKERALLAIFELFGET
jgi:hypothetical protein